MLSKDFQYQIDCWGFLEVRAEMKHHRGSIRIADMLERWATRKHDEYIENRVGGHK